MRPAPACRDRSPLGRSRAKARRESEPPQYRASTASRDEPVASASGTLCPAIASTRSTPESKPGLRLEDLSKPAILSPLHSADIEPGDLLRAVLEPDAPVAEAVGVDLEWDGAQPIGRERDLVGAMVEGLGIDDDPVEIKQDRRRVLRRRRCLTRCRHCCRPIRRRSNPPPARRAPPDVRSPRPARPARDQSAARPGCSARCAAPPTTRSRISLPAGRDEHDLVFVRDHEHADHPAGLLRHAHRDDALCRPGG